MKLITFRVNLTHEDYYLWLITTRVLWNQSIQPSIMEGEFPL
jgi:hypothetical protein